jgi:hypothetical protein
MRKLFVVILAAFLSFTAQAQNTPSCSFEPWVSTGGDAILTICSSTSVSGCASAPVVKNASAAAGIAMVGFGVPTPCSTSNIEYMVKTADISSAPVHHYAFGIVCQSGNCAPGMLYVQTGSLPSGPGAGTFTPAGQTLVTKPWVPVAAGGCASVPCTLPAGIYGLVIGSDCTTNCAVLYGDADTGTFYAFDARNASWNNPWTFDPLAGLASWFANMPAVQPTGQASANSNISRPPTVMVY